MLVSQKAPTGTIQPRQSATVGTHPEETLGVFEDRKHTVAWETEPIVRVVTVGAKLPRRRIVTSQPTAVCAYPKDA